MSFLKYIFELVVIYYILKFVLSFLGNLFLVKQTINKTQNQSQFTDTANGNYNSNSTTNTQTNFEQSKKNINIKDGEYIEYEEVKREK